MYDSWFLDNRKCSQSNLFKSLSPKIQIQILQTDIHRFPLKNYLKEFDYRWKHFLFGEHFNILLTLPFSRHWLHETSRDDRTCITLLAISLDSTGGTLLASLRPLLVCVCSNPVKYSDPNLRASASLALAKFMLVRYVTLHHPSPPPPRERHSRVVWVEMCCRGLQNLILFKTTMFHFAIPFKTKLLHFATLFKTNFSFRNPV